MDLMASTALWAMHPAFLDAMLKKGTFEAMLPDALKALAGMGGDKEAKAADPVREGATMIVPMRGVIAPNGMYSGGVKSDLLADFLRGLAGDAKVGAVVLDIRSPGGLVFGTAELGDAVFELRQAKPVIAVANQYAFSAAHWVATQATAYYATTSGEVGSVGVRSGHIDVSGFEDKIGMKTTLIASSPDKVAGHPYAPLSDEDRADIQASVDESNEAFTAVIARGRNMKAGDVPAVHGSGKTFAAAKAASLGAIDGVMTLRDVVAKYSSSRSRLDLMRRRAAVQAMAAAI